MVEDIASFTERLLRFDPGALVRLRDGRAWGRLPWEVLVSVEYECAGDVVVSAASGEKRDADWHWPLPPIGKARVVEVLPASQIVDLASAAARTLREASAGRRVGERAIRDALLDHPVITGTSDVDGTQFVVPQRIVQGIVRMRLNWPGGVDVLVAGPWTGLRTRIGEAWHRAPAGLTVRPLR
ncbi:hypothetical protein [Allorhizocola rhizosphaerae]|uniref:hypothetical protein n=1 Tax=Allorhizocola rhizosphaerae TaxID=1872709 RepID=UPI000E3DC05E|nr:hypothetical protein [Allorhizocola rhizosphaerae]